MPCVLRFIHFRACSVNKDRIRALSDGARIIDQADQSGGLTKAGRALQKHGNRPGSAFPQPKGSQSDINTVAQEIVDEILTMPGTTIRKRSHPRYGQVFEVRSPDRRGLMYDNNNTLIGFREP